MKSKKISKDELNDFLYDCSKYVVLMRMSLLDVSGRDEKPKRSIDAWEIEDMLRRTLEMMSKINGMQDKLVHMKRYPFTGIAPSECSYADMIHHLEVLNTLPPTNGLGVEIEAVRREALEMLYMRNAKEKAFCE